MKKITAYIALLTVVLSTAQAQYTPVEDLTYTIVSNQVTITGGNANITNLSIPPTIEGFPVTRIGDNAFDYYTYTPSTVSYCPPPLPISGMGLFSGNANLVSIEMPGVTHRRRCLR